MPAMTISIPIGVSVPVPFCRPIRSICPIEPEATVYHAIEGEHRPVTVQCTLAEFCIFIFIGHFPDRFGKCLCVGRFHVQSRNAVGIDPADTRSRDPCRHYRLSAGHRLDLHYREGLRLPDRTEAEHVAGPVPCGEVLIRDPAQKEDPVLKAFLFDPALQFLLQRAGSAYRHDIAVVEAGGRIDKIFIALV